MWVRVPRYDREVHLSRLMRYVEALSVDIGPRPATTDFEYQAAGWIGEQMEAHGLTPSVQEFESPRTYAWAFVIYHALTLTAAVVSGLTDWVWLTAICFVVAAAVAVVLYLDLDTRFGLSDIMPKGPSQNVIARHIPRTMTGDRRRRIVIVAHYDSARSSLAFAPSAVKSFPITFALMKWTTWLTPVMILLQLALPAWADPWIWYATMFVAIYLVVPFVINIHREIAMDWVDGANDNASGVAALLGVLDRVLPIEGDEALRAQKSGHLYGEDAVRAAGVVPADVPIQYLEEDPIVDTPAGDDEFPQLPGIDPRPYRPRPIASPVEPAPSTPEPVPAAPVALFDLPQIEPETPAEPADLGSTIAFSPVSAGHDAPIAPVAPVAAPRETTGSMPRLRSAHEEPIDLDAYLPPVREIEDIEAERWSPQDLPSDATGDFIEIPQSRFHEIGDAVTGMFKKITLPKRKSRPVAEDESGVADWLGGPVESARTEGERIGKWDNFNGDADADDDYGWKGGATATSLTFGEIGHETVSQVVDRLRDSVRHIGDRDLKDKEIWFVATGAEETGTYGMRALLEEYADELRDALIINLDNVGAGQLSWLTGEGMARVYPSDRRLQFVARRVARDREIPAVAGRFRGLSTDGSTALARGFSALTFIGLTDGVPEQWHWRTDTVDAVDPQNLTDTVEIVTGMIAEL